jgi:hypothetical protein
MTKEAERMAQELRSDGFYTMSLSDVAEFVVRKVDEANRTARSETFDEMRAEMGPMCQRRMQAAAREGRTRDYACGISDGLVTAANWAEDRGAGRVPALYKEGK